MTDEMRAREKAICEAANVSDIGEVSDGFHTFNGLYEQRMILFAALVKAYKDKAWKSYRHEDGEYCFGGGWFIVGIDTPEGSYTYHYENKYWDMFDCVDLPRAKHWDGHTEADAETRLMSLNSELHWIPVTERLPETGQDVELCCGYKNYRGEIVRYICIAYHVNRYEMKYSADWDEGCDEYREEDDEYYILEGWYERIHNWDTYGAVKIDDLALAWRELPKLPEPYKEVTE